MLKGVLLAAAVLLFAYSAEPLVHFATNREQITVTCEAFAESPPQALWLRVTGCEMDYLGAGVRERNGRIVELYFPARPVGWARTQPAPLVAATRDPGVLAIAESTMGGGRDPDQEQFLVMMLKIVTALRAAREVEGYGQASAIERARTRAALANLSTPLSPDAVVVDLHARPRVLGPGAAAAAGVLLLGMLVVLRSKRRAARGKPAAAPTVESASPDVPGPLLRVMLLNLPRGAGLDAIETAPPLGARTEVMAALTSALGTLEVDGSGRAALERSDAQLTLDLGPADLVHTVVVRASGDALPILRDLVQQTGWRAFDAKGGGFIADAQEPAASRPLDHTAA